MSTEKREEDIARLDQYMRVGEFFANRGMSLSGIRAMTDGVCVSHNASDSDGDASRMAVYVALGYFMESHGMDLSDFQDAPDDDGKSIQDTLGQQFNPPSREDVERWLQDEILDALTIADGTYGSEYDNSVTGRLAKILASEGIKSLADASKRSGLEIDSFRGIGERCASVLMKALGAKGLEVHKPYGKLSRPSRSI